MSLSVHTATYQKVSAQNRTQLIIIHPHIKKLSKLGIKTTCTCTPVELLHDCTLKRVKHWPSVTSVHNKSEAIYNIIVVHLYLCVGWKSSANIPPLGPEAPEAVMTVGIGGIGGSSMSSGKGSSTAPS